MTFEIRRGDDDSAPSSMLGFDVLVSQVEGTDLKFSMDFENPGSISIGSKPDAIFGRMVN